MSVARFFVFCFLFFFVELYYFSRRYFSNLFVMFLSWMQMVWGGRMSEKKTRKVV